MVKIMTSEVLNKLKSNKKFHNFLRENSNYYKNFNRNPDFYDEFINKMKVKYKLRTIDKVDNFVDSVDLITKIISATNE